jgi:hypothetical protein
MKAPFTRQQQESLGVMKNTLQGMWQLEVAQAERRLFSDIAALRSVLVNKGLVTAEELDAAKAEFEAGLSVEEALNPELQKVWDEVNGVFGEIQEQQQKPKKRKRRRRK